MNLEQIVKETVAKIVAEKKGKDLTGPKGIPDGKIDSADYLKARSNAIEKAKGLDEGVTKDQIEKKYFEMFGKNPNTKLADVAKALGIPEQDVMNVIFTGDPFGGIPFRENELNEDYEVAMAQDSLDSIIRAAMMLKAQMGDKEVNLPAWIQDHITNAENYIYQAAKGYHESDAQIDDEADAEEMNELSPELKQRAYNAAMDKADNAYYFDKSGDLQNDPLLKQKSLGQASTFGRTLGPNTLSKIQTIIGPDNIVKLQKAVDTVFLTVTNKQTDETTEFEIKKDKYKIKSGMVSPEVGRKILKIIPYLQQNELAEARFEKGEDVGGKGFEFKDIAKKAAKQYGSKEAGQRVAGAIMKKVLNKEGEEYNFEKSAVESASGDKISHVEYDDLDLPIFFSAADDTISYHLGYGGEFEGKIYKYDGKTGKSIEIGDLKHYGDGQNHSADDDMHESKQELDEWTISRLKYYAGIK